MQTDSTPACEDTNLFLGAAWFDPIEAGIRDQIRGFIEGLIEEELATALCRGRYQRRSAATTGTDEPPSPENTVGVDLSELKEGDTVTVTYAPNAEATSDPVTNAMTLEKAE